MKTDGVWVIVWAQLDIQAREAGWDPRADAGGEVGRESRTAEVSSARGQGLEGAWRVGRSEHEAGQRAGPRKVHELPRDAAGPSAAPRKGCRRHGRGPTVRPRRAPAPSSHGRPATQSLSSRAWCKPLPTRDCQLNPTLTHTDEHNSPGEAPEGRAPQHEAESAPGWTGQQRRSTRNRRGVATVPASVSLGQVMMPTNPEMLQRSAERA